MIILIILFLINLNGVNAQNYIKKKIYIQLGNQEKHIYPYYNIDHKLMTGNNRLKIGGICTDNNANIYITDIGDSSIKKYNDIGKYIGRIKIPGVLLQNVYCYNNMLFSLDREKRKNDLYIFNLNTLKEKTIKKDLYSWRPDEQNCYFWDNLLIIDKLVKYHVYDLKNDTLIYNIKNPFYYYDDISEKEKEFLIERIKPNMPPIYLGRIDNYFIFFRYFISINNIFELAFVDVERDSILRCDISYIRNPEDLGLVSSEHSRFDNSNYLYSLGFENEKLVINKIDIRKILSNVDLQEASNRYVTEYLNKFTLKELHIMRNTIYARYGKVFKEQWLQNYFEQKLWYHPYPKYSETFLTEYERKHIERIIKVENIKLVKERK